MWVSQKGGYVYASLVPVNSKTTDQWTIKTVDLHIPVLVTEIVFKPLPFIILSFYSPFSLLSTCPYVWYNPFSTSHTDRWRPLWIWSLVFAPALSPKRPNSRPTMRPPPGVQISPLESRQIKQEPPGEWILQKPHQRKHPLSRKKGSWLYKMMWFWISQRLISFQSNKST